MQIPLRGTRFEGTLAVGIANNDGVEIDESPDPRGGWRNPVPEDDWKGYRVGRAHLWVMKTPDY